MNAADQRALAEVIGITRREILLRVEALERRLDADEKGSAAEQFPMVSGANTERQWAAFCQKMQNRDIGEWQPSHASWKGGR